MGKVGTMNAETENLNPEKNYEYGKKKEAYYKKINIQTRIGRNEKTIKQNQKVRNIKNEA